MIRLATPHDIPQMYAISCSVHLTPLYETLIPANDYERFRAKYTPSDAGLIRYEQKIRSYLDDPSWQVWVAESSDKVVGFTITHTEVDALVLKGLFVASEHQGHGIGKQLFLASYAAADGARLVLEVLEGNARAIGMYERAGFRHAGYGDKPFYGAPMLRMQKY